MFTAATTACSGHETPFTCLPLSFYYERFSVSHKKEILHSERDNTVNFVESFAALECDDRLMIAAVASPPSTPAGKLRSN